MIRVTKSRSNGCGAFYSRDGDETAGACAAAKTARNDSRVRTPTRPTCSLVRAYESVTRERLRRLIATAVCRLPRRGVVHVRSPRDTRVPANRGVKSCLIRNTDGVRMSTRCEKIVENIECDKLTWNSIRRTLVKTFIALQSHRRRRLIELHTA